MKRRTYVGIGGLVALGVLLSSLWNGGGLGVGTSGNSDVSVSDDSPTGKSNDESESVGPRDVIDVAIDGKIYLVAMQDKEFVSKSLSEVVSLVEAAKGNEDGIRIRISRRPSSLTSAEVALQGALDAADVAETAVYWRDGGDLTP